MNFLMGSKFLAILLAKSTFRVQFEMEQLEYYTKERTLNILFLLEKYDLVLG